MESDLLKIDKLEKVYDAVFENIEPTYSPRTVLLKANEEIKKYRKDKDYQLTDVTLVQAMSLREFETGVLMASVLPDSFKTMASELSKKLQEEYGCTTYGKKSLAEMAALNYGRILAIQKQLMGFLEKDGYGDLTVKIIATLSKELDKAQRHYLTALQSLEMGLQPPLNVNIKTTTTNIANQQAIQQVGEQTNVKG